MSTETWETLEGGCLCKSVRYEMTRSPIIVSCCHCRNCQIRTGSAFATQAVIEASALKITSDTQPKVLQPRPDVTIFTCPNCTMRLWLQLPYLGPNLRSLVAGTLDTSDKLLPEAHYFVRSKHSWFEIPEGVQTFEQFPNPTELKMSPEGQARFGAAMAQPAA